MEFFSRKIIILKVTTTKVCIEIGPVETDIKFFEISALLPCAQGNSATEWKNSKYVWEFQKCFCRSLPYFYTYPDYNYY